MKFISCASYYGTGSSAVTDLISEYDNVYSFTDEEIRFLHDPDGIDDLYYHIVENPNRHNSGHAIKRYKRLVDFYSGAWWYGKKYSRLFGDNWKKCSYDYINSLIDFSYKGGWFYDLYDRGMPYYFVKRAPQRILSMIPVIKRFAPTHPYKGQITYCTTVEKDDFILKTKKYIESLFDSVIPSEYDSVMVDQLIPSSNIDRYTRYFDDIKVVVVERDPRDVWMCERYVWREGVIPSDSVEDFCKWFKYSRMNRRKEDVDNGVTTLLVHFEDLVFDYYNARKKLESWLGLDPSRHSKGMKLFDPSRSINNTRIWKRYPDEKENIEFIEKNLSEYLYSFPNSNPDYINIVDDSLF